MPLTEAVDLLDINQGQLLWASANGTLSLFCRLSKIRDYIVALEAFQLNAPRAGSSSGVEIPLPQFMPTSARQSTWTGLLSFWDSDAVENAVLASVNFTNFVLAMSSRRQSASGF